MTRRALVFGARGQIGRFLLPRLCDAGWWVDAVTRGPPPPSSQALRWHALDLFAGPDPDLDSEIVLSLGPLDGLVAWFERTRLRPQRVIAFSSTSAASKQESPDPIERELAQRLLASESRLLTLCAQRATRATLLRPTLVYGAGLDRNLTRIAQLARRWHGFVLPRGACGLRQPVHAGDLAEAAWRAATIEAALASSYDLPGGETLQYREMVRRVLACLQPPARLFEVPAGPLHAASAVLRRLGAFGDAGVGVLARLRTDLVYDIEPARRDLDYSPRPFRPGSEMFVSPETI